MSKVLAAIDDSAATRPVLAAAAAVARLLHEELEAVQLRQDGGTTAAAVAEAAGVPLRTLTGPELPSLTAAGREEDVRIVVLGARGTAAGPRPAGHVALALVVALGKPVVVVPPQAPVPYALQQILVPLDGSHEAAAALRETIELARASAVDVTVLHVLHGASLPLFSDQPQHEAEAWRHEFLARHCPHPDQLRLEVRVGLPEHLVLPVAEEIAADLIALAWAQDLSPQRARVVREVLERSNIPVLLLPT